MTIDEPYRPPADNQPIHLADPDGEWPAVYAGEAARIGAALGDSVRVVEHVGSTSVPGLAAKPVIDIVLAVPDSTDEPSFRPALEAAGYTFRLREPDWHEHRLFKRLEPNVNLHVFTEGSVEVDRMIRFRDRLRSDPADFELYLATKRELAARTWATVQDYADAKSAVVEDILTRS